MTFKDARIPHSPTDGCGPKRIVVDGSYTLSSGKSSGIERVVRNVMRECSKLASHGNLPEYVEAISLKGKFYAVSHDQKAALARTASMHRNALATAPSLYRNCAESLCWATKNEHLRKWLLPQPGHLGIFKLGHTLSKSRVRRELAKICQPITARPGDLFLLPDAYWVNRLRSSVWPAAQQARDRGAKVVSLLYDLIPLTHPEYVGAERSMAFLEYTRRLGNHSDMIVAISKTVRDEARQFLTEPATSQGSVCRDIRAFELGAELNVTTGHVRRSVARAFQDGTPPYLMVATFDPRKNHPFVLDAFDSLWQAGGEQKLCLVGRFGARSENTIRRVRNHSELGKKLFLFNDLSDAELQHCYRQARAVIFASTVEGFGLPIVESLWFKKKTIVSDTAIHREVGGADCCYFGLQTPDNLVAEISRWEMELAAGRAQSTTGRRPTSWSDSTAQLLRHCYSLYGANAPVVGQGEQSKAA